MSISKKELELIFNSVGNDPNCVFVETGSHIGETIQLALDVGFKKIISIEFGKELHEHCVARFANNTNVVLYHGDSSKMLYDMSKNIDGPIVFWLDAHYSSGNTAKADKICPLYEEIDQIKKLKNNNHLIMIDDVRDVGGWMSEVTMSGIQTKLLEVNNKYSFSYIDGHIKNDILVASTIPLLT